MPIEIEYNIDDKIQFSVWKITEKLSEFNIENYLNSSEFSFFKKISNNSRKLQWILVRKLFKKYFSNNESIVYNNNGKPISSNGTFISISHSKDYVALIQSQKFNVAIDVESISKRIIRIKHKFVKESELPSLNSENDLIKYCTIIWSAKECLCKLFDYKIFDFINHLTIRPFELSNEGIIISRAIYRSNVYEVNINYRIFGDSVITWCSNNNEHLQKFTR